MRVRSLLFSLCIALALLAPSLAVGAPSAPTSPTTTKPTPIGTMEAQVWPGAEPGTLVVIVSLRLPEEAGLPAVARIPIPEGMTTAWTGEIAGADATGDLSRPFRVAKGRGGDYVEFTATSALLVQAEFTSSALVTKGKQVSARVVFPQSVPATQTSFSVRLPANTKPVKIDPAPIGIPDRNDVGETLYRLSARTLATGEKAVISVSYDDVGITPLPKAPLDTFTLVLWVLGALLIFAVLGLAFVASRRRMRDET